MKLSTNDKPPVTVNLTFFGAYFLILALFFLYGYKDKCAPHSLSFIAATRAYEISKYWFYCIVIWFYYFVLFCAVAIVIMLW